jgi:hypothetical protein
LVPSRLLICASPAPRDPATPVGHLTATLRQGQDRLAAQITAGHKELAQRLE